VKKTNNLTPKTTSIKKKSKLITAKASKCSDLTMVTSKRLRTITMTSLVQKNKKKKNNKLRANPGKLPKTMIMSQRRAVVFSKN